jgi:hypothetical protein
MNEEGVVRYEEADTIVQEDDDEEGGRVVYLRSGEFLYK